VNEPFPITIPDEAAEPPTKTGATGVARLLPKTLTGRLVAGVVVLVAVLVFVIGSATYIALRSFLYDRLDQQVRVSAVQNAEQVARAGGPYGSNDRIYLTPTGQRLWFSLIESDGSMRSYQIDDPQSRKQIALLSLSQNQIASFIAHPGVIRSIKSNGEPLHAQSAALPDGTYVVVALSTSEVHNTMHRLVLLEVIIGSAAVALAAGLTSWGVRRGLRPLHRVTRTAQEVTAELGPDGSGLERRVPDADPATEVGQVASSVNTLLQTVEAEFAARLRNEERMRQFLADASHELRTPLTSIRGYAELSRLQGNSTAASDDPMRRIEVEGTRMSRLVEDLLVLARGDRGNPMHRERVEIDALLAEAASAAESAHPEREITVVPSGGAAVIGDRDQLLRMLLNLLTNASVHTAPDGVIRLEAIQGRTPGGPAVAFKVIDEGPGLPAEDAEHVFERFWRADKARTRARGGSGLGMAIVAQIVESHGGSVHFESSVESGTTVTVTLPLAAAVPTAD
jgi:two-component system OmpR family sensor kinase